MEGYGSLFAYCRQALRLSEDAASNRIHAARACLRFPVILDLLASGELSLSAVRMLRAHLSEENHERVLARARNARRVDIERLLAELAPRPDVPSSVRKVPVTRTAEPEPAVAVDPSQTQAELEMAAPSPITAMGPCPPQRSMAGSMAGSASGPTEGSMITRNETLELRNETSEFPERKLEVAATPLEPVPVPRAVVQPLSPERYRVQFTIGQDAHDILRRVQTLMRREIPDGDAGAIFERALRLLHEEVEADKFGRARRRGVPKRREGGVTPKATAIAPPAVTHAYEDRIRPGADGGDGWSATQALADPRLTRVDTIQPKRIAPGRSRHIPSGVKRAVWYRDRGRCAFVSRSGQRCEEQEFLELHHIQPYALNGTATVANIALRCRRHNAYEAEVVFGARGCLSPRHAPDPA